MLRLIKKILLVGFILSFCFSGQTVVLAGENNRQADLLVNLPAPVNPDPIIHPQSQPVIHPPVSINYLPVQEKLSVYKKTGLVLSGILGIMAVLLMLLIYYTGFLWLTVDESHKIKRNKLWRILLNLAVYLMVILCAYFLVALIVRSLYF